MRSPVGNPLKLSLIAALLLGVVSARDVETPAQGAALSRLALTKADRSMLSEAQAQGKSEVMLLVASASGANARMAQEISRLGGVLRYREDQVDYLRALVPLRSLHTILSLPAIQAVNVDVKQGRWLSHDPGTANRRPPSAPDRHTGPENPYLPTRDIGAPQFVAAHPTFDGRGVTIGFVDISYDLLAPELETALTLEGKPTRKIIDRIETTNPLDGEDATWVKMETEVIAAGGRIAQGKEVYAAPGDRPYRLGFLDERVPYFSLGPTTINGDLNRDGNPPGSSGLFAVLWDEASDMVWVDTDQDRDFRDEKPMREYRQNYDVGLFGRDRPETPVRESLPFQVQIDRPNRFVHIGVSVGGHATNTTTVAAGRSFLGGKFHGVAPGAQIVAIHNGYGAFYLKQNVEGLIEAFKHPKVDVVNASLGELPSLNDGSSVMSVVVNRLVERYRKPVFVSAGNSGPGLNTLNEPSAASRAVSVGGYIHRETWFSNYGSPVSRTEDVIPFSARGPREDGALKPDIIAPAAAFSAEPGVYPGIAFPEVYPMPSGYAMGAGTSYSAPMVAGAAALLISAARQSQVLWDADRIRKAIVGSARFLEGYGAYEQGNGVPRVERAWEILKSLPEEDPTITSRAPVRTVLSQYFAIPHAGLGLYEREGWSAGQKRQRTITFRRTSGPRQALTFSLRWTGNHGTFQTAPSIRLPLNQDVELSVAVHPKTAGVHSAILNLVGEGSERPVHQVLHTIVAAQQFGPVNHFTVAGRGAVESLSVTRHFFHVLPESNVFHLRLDVEGTVIVRVLAPDGKEISSFPGRTWSGYRSEGTWEFAFERPAAGVWEVVVDNTVKMWQFEKASREASIAYEVKASLLDVGISPDSIRIDPAGEGRTVSIGNRLAGFRGCATGSPLGSAFVTRDSLAAGALPKVYELNVLSGSTLLRAEVGRPSAPGADLDLSLFDCTQKECSLRATSAAEGSEEIVAMPNPQPGLWKVVVDLASEDSARVAYDYEDAVFHPMYGRLRVADEAASRRAGDEWRATLKAELLTAPAAGRSLVGLLQITSEEVRNVEYWPKPGAPHMTFVDTTGSTSAPISLGMSAVQIVGFP